MKDHRLIRALRGLIMSALCWVNNYVTGYGCSTDERWIMELGWWLEGKLEAAWWELYQGSSEELEDALDGRPLDHMTERQQAHYIGVMAAGGKS